MRFHYIVRKAHSWALILFVVPLLLMGVTGVLLQLKKQLVWVQPAEQARPDSNPALGLNSILSVCRSREEAQIASWSDVERIDIRPSRGVVKVTSTGGWELQLDAETGEVLSSAKRLSDIVEALHDGSWFGRLAKFGLFLPAGIVLCIGAGSGLYLFVLPLARRLRRQRVRWRMSIWSVLVPATGVVPLWCRAVARRYGWYKKADADSGDARGVGELSGGATADSHREFAPGSGVNSKTLA